ncbi:esterase PHB depolymerase domain-containing protein [Hirsutella rhossiliensis]|uniref:feruloyl esterase n=1 Tax=Hirsutella rhossiliensis TaxID=111463 RepID=A0A9P8SGI4_9HYPO|nr:esterase PHB depolymerase domain-containing protein [Hirsutella rhossiliensis]KAH0960006.1 esterase PHB depolymerase domain-containing protein [Hirsutella rhossiliensis]
MAPRIGVSFLALILGLACAVQGAAIHRRASPGCGKSHDFVGKTREFSFQSSGGKRTYRIHLPSNYEADKPKPLLIAYHGAGNKLEDFENETRFSDESVNPDMIAVYPAGVDKHWQGPSYAKKGVDDEAFTTDLVNRIKGAYCVDEARVYATGHSNGAGFAGTLACSSEHGGQFAAFAPVSGAFYTDVVGNRNCHPSRSPLPMMELHGTADRTIPYEGGDARGGRVPAIPDWLSRWAKRNQCSSSSTKDLPGGVHDIKWKCAGGEGLVRHIKMDGQSHKWPGKDSAFDASPAVVDFLSAFRKP